MDALGRERLFNKVKRMAAQSQLAGVGVVLSDEALRLQEGRSSFYVHDK
jgi:hypothetical protein